MSLHTWAIRWGVSAAALVDLQHQLGLVTPPFDKQRDGPTEGKSEAFVQSLVRLEASQKGYKLFRNNVGALKDERGRVVRYGLANDSTAMNEVVKSADLIGWRSFVIPPQLVGCKFAQFVSREVKESGWQYTGTEREPAQKAWNDAVNADGGDAAFVTGLGSL